jgi:hypothetical protein
VRPTDGRRVPKIRCTLKTAAKSKHQILVMPPSNSLTLHADLPENFSISNSQDPTHHTRKNDRLLQKCKETNWKHKMTFRIRRKYYGFKAPLKYKEKCLTGYRPYAKPLHPEVPVASL